VIVLRDGRAETTDNPEPPRLDAAARRRELHAYLNGEIHRIRNHEKLDETLRQPDMAGVLALARAEAPKTEGITPTGWVVLNLRIRRDGDRVLVSFPIGTPSQQELVTTAVVRAYVHWTTQRRVDSEEIIRRKRDVIQQHRNDLLKASAALKEEQRQGRGQGVKAQELTTVVENLSEKLKRLDRLLLANQPELEPLVLTQNLWK
jgi:hypothetical protein